MRCEMCSRFVMGFRACFTAFCVACLLISGGAKCVAISIETWSLTGQVTFIDPNLATEFAPGEILTAIVTFDTSVVGVPRENEPQFIVYSNAVLSWSFKIGDYFGNLQTSHQVDAIVSAGVALAFSTVGDDIGEPVGSPIVLGVEPGLEWTPMHISASFRDYPIGPLSQVSSLPLPSGSNNGFRLDFSSNTSNQSVALLADGISVSRLTPAAVPDTDDTLLNLSLAVTVLLSLRIALNSLPKPST